ncbi:hypothetical protein BHM03_00009171 [Ensete ventricosum]|nr:hypothetical protein BHM03_00009171 [Ensete ventricosum]
MGAPQAIEMLTQRASVLRESLQRSRSNTERMVAMLGSFDHRLSALESAMRPTQVRLPTPSNLKCSGLCIGSLIGRLQVRTRAIRMAHENIDNTLKATAVVLTHFELLRQAEVAILKGPDEDLQSFLDAVDLLQCNIRFFSTNKISMSEYGLLNHANNLLSKAVVKLGDEFRQLLATYSKPIDLEFIAAFPPNSLPSLSRATTGSQSDGGNHAPASNHSEHQGRSLETPMYKTPTLMPPRILPLLHNLAEQLVQAGYQQRCSRIYSYRLTMERILQEVEFGNKTDSQLAIMTMRIMQSLQNNLDGKSKQYKDPALTYLFLMNNIHYMVRSLSRLLVENSSKPQKYNRYTPEDIEQLLDGFFQGNTLGEPKAFES